MAFFLSSRDTFIVRLILIIFIYKGGTYMRLIKKIKKGTAVILSAALMAGLVPFMPHSVSKVQAAAGSKEPSVTAYATKEQLMDKTFTPNYKGISDIVGKLAFGNDEDGNIQEWYKKRTDI